MLECAVDSLVVVVVSVHPQPFHRDGHPCTVDCPAGTHGCDLVSRVRLDQSANPVVMWLGLVSRVVRSSWSHGAFIHECLYSHTILRHGRVTSWPTLGSTLVFIRLVRIGTPVTLTFNVTSLQHCDLASSLTRCHSRSHGFSCSTPSAPDASHPLACQQH